MRVVFNPLSKPPEQFVLEMGEQPPPVYLIPVPKQSVLDLIEHGPRQHEADVYRLAKNYVGELYYQFQERRVLP